MSNVFKRKTSVSKRHIRRIIEDETNIDMAGSSTQIQIKLSPATNKSFEDNCLNLHKLNNINVFAFNENITNEAEIDISENESYLQCQNKNNSDMQIDCDHDSYIDNPTTESKSRSAHSDADDNNKFKNDIAVWALSYNINHNACNALMKILRQHTSCNFPKDVRTLLGTPRQVNVIDACGGEYFYIGLNNVIKKMFLKSHEQYINLLINIDGLPLSKSSHASLWPILCSNTRNKDVYLIGAYFGNKKPQDSNTFLQPLVNELISLSNGYIYENNVIKVKLSGLICDAPAKSFVLCTKGHTGFYSCTKCTIKGKYLNGRICFPNTSYSLRTDDLFAINGYKNFQTGYSIVNNIPGFLPITNTPLDYMHLLCLGVVKKLILLWMKGPLSVRLSPRLIKKISYLLIMLRNTTPNDFVRKPRCIQDVKQWKAVEFRNFLLYTGPIVLKYSLKKDLYHHFLLLHVATTILIRPDLCKTEFINYAEALLKTFVLLFEILYGKKFISHNVHNLLHLCSDVRIYGCLDNFSAFRFENYMMSIKKLLKKKEKPLQQLMKRFSEQENFEFLLPQSNYTNESLYSLKYLHNNGLIPDCINFQSQYLQLSTLKFNIHCKSNNNRCYLLKNGCYVDILNIVQNKKNIFVIGKKLTYISNVYELPCKSSELGIQVMMINCDEIFSYPITDVLCKVWKIPFANKPNIFAVFPLNHTM